MKLKIPLTLWLVLLALVTQIRGVPITWPQILTDVGDYPDTNTGPLPTDLNNGLSPDTTGPNGWTAVHLAAGLNKPKMAAILKIKGADLNIQDSDSYTPLHIAAGHGSPDVIGSLYPVANTEIKGPNQWTPLHVAAGNGFSSCVTTLIFESANINAAESHGWTPLHIAVGNGYDEVVAYILHYSDNVNKDAQDNHGYTPLHVAAGNNQKGAASILLNSGASITILDNDGHTAKQVAAFLGYTDIVALIP